MLIRIAKVCILLSAIIISNTDADKGPEDDESDLSDIELPPGVQKNAQPDDRMKDTFDPSENPWKPKIKQNGGTVGRQMPIYFYPLRWGRISKFSMCKVPCREIYGVTGDIVCDCRPQCTPPKCGPGCEVQKYFYGPCPGCDCKSFEDEPWNPHVVMEQFPCPPTCEIIFDASNGKYCDCKPKCDPPKCEPGCEIQKVFDGPCPGCDCKENEDKDIGDVPAQVLECAPVKCSAPCTELPGGLGECPICKCPVCVPPQCPPGCSIQKVFDGPCPGCDCEEDEELEAKVICDPPKCAQGCFLETEFEGPCPKCVCKNEEPILCTPPICPPKCSIQKVFDGPCPGCDCDEKDEEIMEEKIEDPKPILCTPPICPPKCSIQKIFDGPCPGCDCDEKDEEIIDDIIKDLKDPVLCSPPRCPPGCSIQKVFNGPCPGCDCNEEEEEIKQCAIPKCKSWCRIKTIEGGCPICYCPTWRHG